MKPTQLSELPTSAYDLEGNLSSLLGLADTPGGTGEPHCALIVKQATGVKTYPIAGERSCLGRHASNDIIIYARGVSRHHAVLYRLGANYYITDGDGKSRKSINGLYVNRQACSHQRLQSGDVITFCQGVYAFFVVLPTASAAAWSFTLVEKLVNFCDTSAYLETLLEKNRDPRPYNSVTLCLSETGQIQAMKEVVELQNQSLYPLLKGFIHQSLTAIVLPDDMPKVTEAIYQVLRSQQPHTLISELNLEKEGIFCEIEIFLSAQGGLIARIEPIVRQSSLEAKLLHEVRHDALTQLPNRTLFKNRVSRLIQQFSNQNYAAKYAVLFVDLDRFKLVNDSFGHLIGDRFLVQIAQRLQVSVRPHDLIARLGGDEFAILLEEINHLDEAIEVAKRLQAEIEKPLVLNGYELFPSASIGVATSDLGYQSVDEILRDADTAMYQAKLSGRAQFAVFNDHMRNQAKDNLKLNGDLKRAIQKQEFRLMYQPIVNLKRQKLVGFEALIRWLHPDRGLLGPHDFIPQSEENGLITEIGYWALQSACQQLATWNHHFKLEPGFAININISAKQLADPSLVDNIEVLLMRYGLNPCQIKLEITESIVMENSESAIAIFNQLRTLGVQVCIDDFGTGYSSLSYLNRFPIDALKIDRSFVTGMGSANETTGLSIVQSIIGLAHNLGVKVVAEGIETGQHLLLLQASRCDFGQGYLFAKPLAIDCATAMLNDQDLCQWHYGRPVD
ncbi:EAL domain-containing protein [Nodosilinea sp. E11]|uniref:EAL domain-containing protein n=1 Tax=Nodosilinea sp. E11 TaxID=3037479 RepID=UPI002934F8F4|nr:EAL domain-containing protein [Nodosilinea sp. E11]WOD40280.1 EAL domain-containing protein [Nodosilinea sp. E11]